MADKTIVLTWGDNYIYLFAFEGRRAMVVDPGEASVVSRTLEQHDLTLATILLTHHHGDHTGGVAQLKAQTGCDVIGPEERRMPRLDRVVGDDEILTLGAYKVKVLATPGHTRTSVCYYVSSSASNDPGIVWSGDTLFVGGCGRPMECDASILWRSLTKVMALPDATRVYCGHDYTAENCEFALTIEPDNQSVRRRLRAVEQAAAQGQPTVPSTIAEERATNIFLRAGDSDVQLALGMADAEPEKVFAELRHRKNLFG